MLKVTYNDDEVKNALGGVGRALRDFSIPMAEVTEKMEQAVRNTWRTMTDPWGVPWPAWSQTTINVRAKAENYEQQILKQSGDLFGTIGRTHTATTGEVFAGGELPYAEAQQFGNPNNKAWGGVTAPLPPRPFFPMHTPEQAELPEEWIVWVLAPFELALKQAANP